MTLPRTALAAVTGAALTLSLSSSVALADSIPNDAKKISNETTRTFWVNPNDSGPIRNAPSNSARALTTHGVNQRRSRQHQRRHRRRWPHWPCICAALGSVPRETDRASRVRRFT